MTLIDFIVFSCLALSKNPEDIDIMGNVTIPRIATPIATSIKEKALL
jgi:hypothetical protein